MKSIRYIMYFVLMSMTMSLLAQENAQAVAQGENKIDEKVERNTIRNGNGLFNDKNIPKLRSNTVKLWKLTLRRKLQHTI